MQIIVKHVFSAALCGLAAFFTACSKTDSDVDQRLDDLDSRLSYLESKDPKFADQYQQEEIAKLYPKAERTDSGLYYIVTEEGEGEETPEKGDMVTAHYHGTLLNGETFDSSIERGSPFSFQVGMGRVIKGWDEAFLDMKKGEKRTLIIPSKLGYGARSMGPIPSNSVLVFDVELLDFK
ncbi:FKBP-type peptidyl-prolyl cis-trans isomerase [Pelagicoccus sp. SDUM812003]|uniref:FKBP-type peptidyl-prolyl cis-trans isomerase n=1 Tax=Pelagicoccus sp. SDUM812003 TaxID=3041267 RepID=UPI00280D62CC|nr:FKBP-type peptidyl-prolyl cis-trans isomerase [Pelagicoccus sp. SDUM812003]MDQ8204444.1 FKBP-type peptidyl-prolyl cis-trans isomerase [Pelagicoccus sp. SDUM812003]